MAHPGAFGYYWGRKDTALPEHCAVCRTITDHRLMIAQAGVLYESIPLCSHCFDGIRTMTDPRSVASSGSPPSPSEILEGAMGHDGQIHWTGRIFPA